jgi:hypothetical protein
MRLPFLFAALCAVSACAPPAQVSKSQPSSEVGVGFGSPSGRLPVVGGGGGSSMARDFMDLTFAMESGRPLEVFSRFEGPVTVALVGAVPPTAPRDLGALIGRLSSEAGIDISAAKTGQATITVEFTKRADLRRLAPTAACFVVPGVSSLAEYRRTRGSDAVDWALVTRRTRAAIFIPTDTSPQEIRDCLHEELAQALGPLNDLYRLSNSVFNDDNFQSVLTSFDMAILRATYAPELASGMTRAEVAARLPALLGSGVLPGNAEANVQAPGAWAQSIETALGRSGGVDARRKSAERALSIARAQGWRDSRLAFSHFAVARLWAGSDPERAVAEFDNAAAIYAALPGGDVQIAHIDMQRAAMALSAGLNDAAIRLANKAIPVVKSHENAALLATLMLIKAEALERSGDPAAAAALRLDSQVWARYGFGSDSVVRDRMRDIATVADRAANG